MYREVYDGGSPCSVSILKYVIIACMWLISPHVACQSFKKCLRAYHYFLRPMWHVTKVHVDLVNFNTRLCWHDDFRGQYRYRSGPLKGPLSNNCLSQIRAWG